MSENEEGFLSEFGINQPETSWRIRTSKRLVSILFATLLVPISSVVLVPPATAASNVSSLSALTTTAGTLSPAFASGTTSYSVAVATGTATTTVTPTKTDSGSTIQVQINNGGFSTVTSGSPSSSLALAATGSASTVDILVTAADGVTTTEYTITIYRGAFVPSAPAYVSAVGTGVNRVIRVDWTASPGATAYRVQNSTGSAATGCESIAVLTCSFTAINGTNNTNGSTYTVRVIASAGSGINSVASANALPAEPNNAAGTAQKAVLSIQPQNAVNGVAFPIQPVVRITSGSLVLSTSTATVTASITAGGGSLIGTTAVAAVAGVATFTNLGIVGATSASTITFTPTALTAIASQSFSVGSTALQITTQPTNSVSGGSLTDQPVVRAINANTNNTVTVGSTLTMSASISSGSGGVLSGGSAVVTAGVATFTNLVITGPAGTYTLLFTPVGLNGGLSAVTSSSFTLVGAASKLAAGSALGATSGAAFTTQPVVTIQDSANSTVSTGSSSTAIVSVAVSGGDGLALTVGSLTKTAVAGVATFSGFGLTGTTGQSYTLTYSAGSLTIATGLVTMATGAAIKLFAGSALGAISGVAFTTQPVIEIRDSGNNLVTTGSSSGAIITAALTVGSGGTLGGTLTATGSAGVATFTNLAITGSAGGYTIQYSAGSLTVATGNITVGAAPTYAVTYSAGSGSGTPPTQASLATGSTFVVATGSTLSLSGYSFNGWISSGSGVTPATFSAGSTYVMGASDLTLTAQWAIRVATKLSNNVAASSSSSGATFTTQPQATIQDANNFTVTTGSSATAIVTVALSGGSATFNGTKTATAVGGIATFTGLSITGPAATYTLTYSAGSLTVATNTIVITSAAATKLSNNVAASSSSSGATFTTQPQATIQDANNFTVTTGSSATAIVSVALSGGSATFGGTLTATAVGGIATFTGLSITGPAATYTLTYSDC